MGGDMAKSFQQEYDAYCKLSKKNRMRGFIGCFLAGWIIAGCSLFTLPGVALGKPAPFAILYTIGNLVALSSTFFLWGPKSQFKNMFKPIRAGATVIYLVMLLVTLIVAFTVSIGILVLICVAIQFCAMVWYAASYIPYGRTLIKKTIGGVVKSVNNES